MRSSTSRPWKAPCCIGVSHTNLQARGIRSLEDDTLQGSLGKDLIIVTDLGIARLEEKDDEDPAPEKRCHYEEARKT